VGERDWQGGSIRRQSEPAETLYSQMRGGEILSAFSEHERNENGAMLIYGGER
jgi:hypothetical protein